MNNAEFYKYVKKYGEYQTRSMFGAVGLFVEGAMYALISNERIYLRGGEQALDSKLISLGCEKYCHDKKQSKVIINYYDISELYLKNRIALEPLIIRSIEIATHHRHDSYLNSNKRLRDLINLNFTLERMLKKSGIADVCELKELGAVQVFNAVQHQYGRKLDITLLWKFAGAIDGIHWELLDEAKKLSLLSSLQPNFMRDKPAPKRAHYN